MNIQRFTAPDMRTAIRRVRQEFGPDAVILKSEKCEEGVRIVCGMDFDERALDAPEPVHLRQPPRDPAPDRARARLQDGAQGRAAPRAADSASRPVADPRETVSAEITPSAPAPAPEDAQLRAMRRELRSLRGLLRSELATLTQTNLEQNQPLRADILRKFSHMGMDPNLAKRLTEGVANVHKPTDAWRVTLAALVEAMPRAEYDLLSRGGVFAFYGPAGAGKTSAVVRLAARFAARHGRQSVGLVSADTQRPGAQTEMLRRGQELGVYTLAVSSAAETREAIEILADRRLVLIDTAAMTPRDAQLAEQAALLRSVPHLRPWLVLPATTQGSALQDMVNHLSALRPSACVLTRLDECVTLGEALSVLIRCGLPVAFASSGPQRPEDLEAVDPDWLVRRMIQRWKARRRSEESEGEPVYVMAGSPTPSRPPAPRVGATPFARAMPRERFPNG